MKAVNMTSSKGNKVPNQLIIVDFDTDYFQSYNSIIVKRHKGQITLDERFWDYSVTTGKYRNEFLGETKKETEAKIQSGEYKLDNLN